MTFPDTFGHTQDQKRVTSSNTKKPSTASGRIDLNKDALLNSFDQTTAQRYKASKMMNR